MSALLNRTSRLVDELRSELDEARHDLDDARHTLKLVESKIDNVDQGVELSVDSLAQTMCVASEETWVLIDWEQRDRYRTMARAVIVSLDAEPSA